MADVVSVRLDERTRRMLARLARVRRRSRSQVVREAIALLAEKTARAERPYEAWKDVIGMIRDGPSDLSERTGNRVRRLLETRRRRRR